MKRHPLVAGAVVALLATPAACDQPSDAPFKSTNCSTAQTQIELDWCANRDFEAQDGKLNALYRDLMSKYDAKNQAVLRASERRWITERDRQCNAETADSVGGSMHPMLYSSCLSDKTKARIKKLEAQRNR